jgi:hypothetical protein
MQTKSVKLVHATLVAVLALLVTLTVLQAPGTEDVVGFMKWAGNARILGIRAGFIQNEDRYPPLTSLVLLGSAVSGNALGVDRFVAIKYGILLFLLLTSIVFWLWTRNFWLTVTLHLGLVLNSAAHGYVDVFFAPSLLLSLWALKEKKLVLFTVFYCIACLTKYQPLAIAPLIGVYLLGVAEIRNWRQIDFKRVARIAAQVLVPAGLIGIAAVGVYGARPLFASLRIGLSEDFLSGLALNFNWILTYWLHVTDPARFGGLIDGMAQVIHAPDMVLVPHVLFYLFYLSVVVAFLMREKTFENLINFSLLGYLAYFTFNTSVHENHLFLAAILSIILVWLNRERLWTMVIVLLMSNINLLLFFGITGRHLGFSRVIANTIDAALPLSIFNVVFFLVIWGESVLRRPKETQVSRPLDGQQPQAAS